MIWRYFVKTQEASSIILNESTALGFFGKMWLMLYLNETDVIERGYGVAKK